MPICLSLASLRLCQPKLNVATWLIHQLLLLIAASWREVKETNQYLPGCLWLALCQNVIRPIEHNRVMHQPISHQVPLRWHPERDNSFFFCRRTLGEEEDRPGNHESYLQLLVKLPCPPEMRLKAGNTTPSPLIPQKQAWEGSDIGCTFFNTAHNSSGEDNVVSCRVRRRERATTDPLRRCEGTRGQGLRGTLASPQKRVNVLVIRGQRCSSTLIHHHWQNQQWCLAQILCHHCAKLIPEYKYNRLETWPQDLRRKTI